jgi:hypothetical protein
MAILSDLKMIDEQVLSFIEINNLPRDSRISLTIDAFGLNADRRRLPASGAEN